MQDRLEALSQSLGYRFRKIQLLEEALTHPSVLAGQGRNESFGYERLEFLGDRVLGLAVAAMLYRTFPHEAEGALARRHTALVRREALARVALVLGLDRVIELSKGEKDSGGNLNPTILADACEAILGAIYADGGKNEAERLVVKHWTPLMSEDLKPPKDAKSALQEWAQGQGKPLPAYQVIKQEGPSHDPRFWVSVTVEGCSAATGEGSSKRSAEQTAAQKFLEKFT